MNKKIKLCVYGCCSLIIGSVALNASCPSCKRCGKCLINDDENPHTVERYLPEPGTYPEYPGYNSTLSINFLHNR